MAFSITWVHFWGCSINREINFSFSPHIWILSGHVPASRACLLFYFPPAKKKKKKRPFNFPLWAKILIIIIINHFFLCFFGWSAWEGMCWVFFFFFAGRLTQLLAGQIRRNPPKTLQQGRFYYLYYTNISWGGVNSMNECPAFAVRMSMRPSQISRPAFICSNSLFDVFYAMSSPGFVITPESAVLAVNVRCHFYLFSHHPAELRTPQLNFQGFTKSLVQG